MDIQRSSEEGRRADALALRADERRDKLRKSERPLRDDEVDRAEMEVQRCMELTVTNRSKA